MKLLFSSVLVALLASSASALTGNQAPSSGGVTLRANVPTGSVLDPGDRIAFEYQTAQDAAVIVFDIDTQGYVRLLNPVGEPARVRAHETKQVPDDGSELVVEGEPGVEFLFAVSVDDPEAVDVGVLESLRDTGGTPRRIDGDPFVAANMIASELVRNVSRHAVFLGYTYFYVSERVEYPCYLCGDCDGSASKGSCDGYRIVQDFDRRGALAYPLQRGYEMVDLAAGDASGQSTPGEVALPDEDDDVVVNFYPYGSEVQYADPMAMNLWYDWGWYDPFFWSYPYCYPYSGWSFSFGFGFGWGWGWGWGWPGYYCSGYYDPYWGGGGCYPYYGDYPSYAGGYPDKFKSKYKSGTGGAAAASLAGNRAHATRKDGDLRVASSSVRTKSAAPASYRSKSAKPASSRYDSGRRVKTSVSGTHGGTRGVVRQTWTKSRASGHGAGSVDRARTPSMYRSKAATRGSSGRSVNQRSGAYRTKGSGVSPAPRGSSRSSAPTPRMKGSGSGGPSRSSTHAPAYRGGGHSRSPGSGSHGGRGYGGGGMKSAPRGRGR